MHKPYFGFTLKRDCFILLFFVAAILSGCNLDRVPFPQVKTEGVDPNGTTFEVTFEGSLTELAGVKDHGFVWSTSDNPTLENGNVVALGIPANQVFEQTLSGFSVLQERYYVVAYVMFREAVNYGEVLDFNLKSFEVSAFSVDADEIDNNSVLLSGSIRITNSEEFDSLSAHGHVISPSDVLPEIGKGDAIHTDLGSTRDDGLFQSEIFDLAFQYRLLLSRLC